MEEAARDSFLEWGSQRDRRHLSSSDSTSNAVFHRTQRPPSEETPARHTRPGSSCRVRRTGFQVAFEIQERRR